MKNKKGFTLIELLAVIVILAIIALIATPLVLKYIEKSRQEAAKASVLSYVSAIETEVAASQLKNKIYQDKTNYNFDEIVVSVKGSKPTKGTYSLKKGIIESGNFCVNGYNVDYTINGAKVNGTCDGKGNDSNDVQGEVVFEQSVEFSLDYEGDEDHARTFIGYLNGEKIDKTKLIDGASYQIIIGDEGPVEYVGYIEYNYDLGMNIFVFSTANKENEILILNYNSENTMAAFVSEDIQSEGIYDVKLVLIKENDISQVIRIDGGVSVISNDLFEGTVNVKVVDNEGNSYWNNSTEIRKNASYYYFDIYILNKNLYNALSNGKIITIIITGTVDGVEVTKTLGGSAFTYAGDDYDYYYLGNNNLPLGFE